MKKTIAIICMLILGSAVAFAGTTKPITCTGYDIAFVDLDDQGETGYLVRIHGDFPSGTAIPAVVMIGDRAVEEYGGTQTGIYFVAKTKAELDKINGGEIQVGVNVKSVKGTGIKLQTASFDLTKKLKLTDALMR